jgi:hypothetical protein
MRQADVGIANEWGKSDSLGNEIDWFRKKIKPTGRGGNEWITSTSLPVGKSLSFSDYQEKA